MRRRPVRESPAVKVPWGWLEWVVIGQTMIPALLFVPGLSPIRTASRIASYGITLIAGAMIYWSGRGRPGAESYPPRPWLIFVVAWLALSIFHPNSESLLSATAQTMLYVAVLAPAFWAPAALISSAQIGRLMAILFLCNSLSSVVGIGQVFRPETFNPPVIPAMSNMFKGEDLIYEGAGGRRIMRPCGLTDTPGGVSPAGAMAAIVGMCWALRPIAFWKRLGSVGLAFAGVAVLYYTQVRSAMVMVGVCLIALTILLLIQRNYRAAGLLGLGSTVLVLGALAWVAATAGDAIVQRFATLLGSDPGKLYQSSRGGYVEHALGEVLWDYPLGYGLGWWGMVNSNFGNVMRPSPVWVEVMVPAWVYDGGFPLLLAYVGAVVVAMANSLRIALTSRDKDLAFWAAVVVATNLSILASCMSFITFVAPIGIQFWLMSAALHAADLRVNSGRPRPRSKRAQSAA